MSTARSALCSLYRVVTILASVVWMKAQVLCVCRQNHKISQRCLDIDKAVPQHMGISKAILENVIFVHQEDANWPLKESKILVRHRLRSLICAMCKV